MAIIQAHDSTGDLWQVILQAMATRQQNEARREQLKLEKEQLKLQQDQQRAEQERAGAEQQAAAANVIGGVMSPDRDISAAVGGLPAVQAFLGQLGNANIPAGQGMAAAIPADLGPVVQGTTRSGGGARDAIATVQAQRARAVADADLKKYLSPDEFAAYQAVNTMEGMGIPAALSEKLLAAKFPETALQRVQREKAAQEVRKGGDEIASDKAATTFLKQRGVYPAEFPEAVSGAAALFNTFLDIDRRAAVAAGEKAATKTDDAIKFVSQLAASYTRGASGVMTIGGMTIDMGSGGALEPAEAVARATEVAVRVGIMTPEQAGSLNQAALVGETQVHAAANAYRPLVEDGASFEDVRKQLVADGVPPRDILKILKLLGVKAK